MLPIALSHIPSWYVLLPQLRGKVLEILCQRVNVGVGVQGRPSLPRPLPSLIPQLHPPENVQRAKGTRLAGKLWLTEGRARG